VPAALVKHFRGRRDLVLVDVGASEGHFTASLEKFCGIRRALLVEPLPHRCEQLRNRFRSGDFQVVCAAAGDCEKEIDLEVLAFDYSTSLLKIKREDPSLKRTWDFSVARSVKTRVRTLDSICAEHGLLEGIDLLKLDVQGAEALALSGARQITTRVKAIWSEVSFRPLYEGAVTFADFCDLCRAKGFKLHALEEGFRGSDGELLQGDCLFVRTDV
jgi:FkbM family methyltransferase